MSSPPRGDSVRPEATPFSDNGGDARSSVTLGEDDQMEWPSGFPSRLATPEENPLEEAEFLRANRERYLRNTQYNSTPAGQFRDSVNALLQTWGINTLYTPQLYLDRAEIYIRHKWAQVWQDTWGDRPEDHRRWRHELPFFLHAPHGPLAIDWAHCERMRRDRSRPFMVFFQHMIDLFTERVMDLLAEYWATGSEEHLYQALFAYPLNPTAYNTVKTVWISRGIWNDTWGLWPGFHWNHEIPIDEILAIDPSYQRHCRDVERLRAEQQNGAGPAPNVDDELPEEGTGVTEPQPSPVPETPPTPQLTRANASLPSGRESSIPIPSVEAEPANDENGANADVSSAPAPPSTVVDDYVIDFDAPFEPPLDEEMSPAENTPPGTRNTPAATDSRQHPNPITREGAQRRRQPRPPGPCRSGRISRPRPNECCAHHCPKAGRCPKRRWRRHQSYPL